ncbi:MAG: hypothetical protein A4E49_03391 [Methanosaeta sp. PtaU1.Bin112]|nr:MAG: hypothetical protein A4E49_03391 [Methanosaeta sp. PtaU1.Bin112]
MPVFLASRMDSSIVFFGARPEMTTASAAASAARRTSRFPVSRVFRSRITKAPGLMARISLTTLMPSILTRGVPTSMRM